jgi:hypothetical protein
MDGIASGTYRPGSLVLTDDLDEQDLFVMRRAIVAVTIGGVLLTASACDSKTDPDAAPATATTPSAAPASSAPDYSANTAVVCGNVQKIFDTGLKDFATDLGKMIANKEAKQTAAAATAQKAAAKELKDVGEQVKDATESAEDPDVQSAGAESAAKFMKTASDAGFFNKIKTTKDLDKIIEAQLNEWFTPVAGYCIVPTSSASTSASPSAAPSASS